MNNLKPVQMAVSTTRNKTEQTIINIGHHQSPARLDQKTRRNWVQLDGIDSS